MKRDERLAIWERDSRACGICGEPVALADLDIDHLHPKMRGGVSTPDNLRAAHKRCNYRRGRSDYAALRAERHPVRPTPTQIRVEPLALKRLDALVAKLTMTRTAVVHLAIARLAEKEGLEERAREEHGRAES